LSPTRGALKRNIEKFLEHFEIDWRRKRIPRPRFFNCGFGYEKSWYPDYGSIDSPVGKRKGIPIISEIEFASNIQKLPLLGLQVVMENYHDMLTNHILKAAD